MTSVVIVTRNRSPLLKKALDSLLVQKKQPNEVVVIDNQSTDDTSLVVAKFKKTSGIPTRHILEKKVGYPFVYNAGLEKAKNKWVVFMDDDCVASSDWLSQIQKTIQSHPTAAVILGESKTLSSRNIFSLVIYVLDQYWKKNGIHGNKVLNYEILDNKNIIYNKQFLNKNHIHFDESRSNVLDGAAEDCDLGKQIERTGGAAIYQSKAIVYHQDPTHLLWFIKRFIKSYAAYLSFQTKWPPAPPQPQRIKLKKIIHKTIQGYQLGSLMQIQLTLFLGLVITINIVLAHLLKMKFFQHQFIALAENI
jgi:glycosyltransferase involved in cell wall biosynthesis